MIVLDHVTKRFGGAADRPAAVDDLSLEVDDGEIVVLLGSSGCGKTTTLRMINRLIEATSRHDHRSVAATCTACRCTSCAAASAT